VLSSKSYRSTPSTPQFITWEAPDSCSYPSSRHNTSRRREQSLEIKGILRSPPLYSLSFKRSLLPVIRNSSFDVLIHRLQLIFLEHQNGSLSNRTTPHLLSHQRLRSTKERYTSPPPCSTQSLGSCRHRSLQWISRTSSQTPFPR